MTSVSSICTVVCLGRRSDRLKLVYIREGVCQCCSEPYSDDRFGPSACCGIDDVRQARQHRTIHRRPPGRCTASAGASRPVRLHVKLLSTRSRPGAEAADHIAQPRVLQVLLRGYLAMAIHFVPVTISFGDAFPQSSAISHALHVLVRIFSRRPWIGLPVG